MRGSILARQLFDAHHYARQHDRYARTTAIEYRDFLDKGWKEGFNPNAWFSCTEYLDANPDIRAAELNPWLHFIRSGRFEDRPLRPIEAQGQEAYGPLTLQQTLEEAARPLVDSVFYSFTNPDVEVIGLTPAEHFMRFGWREGRIPAPWFDVDYLSKHAPLYRLNSGNSLTELLRITTGAPADTKIPESFWVNDDQARSALDEVPRNTSTLVLLHAYYPDDLDTFSPYLHRLPTTTHAVVTCPANSYEVCRRWAARNDFKVTIIETVNRGRDWGPFLAVTQELNGLGASAILKLHTKRSPHREDGSVWLENMLDGLVPTESTASEITELFTLGNYDILCAPGTLSSASNWKPHRKQVQQFYSNMTSDKDFDFPAGSMFWLSPRLMKEVAALNISISDFEPELGQLDGTLAHALERAVARLSPKAPGLVPN